MMKTIQTVCTAGLLCASIASAVAATLADASTLNLKTLAPTVNGLTPVKETKTSPELLVVGNAEVKTELLVNGKAIPVHGNSSFNLRSSEAALKGTKIEAATFNLVLKDVPQAALTYGQYEGEENGVLTFTSSAGGHDLSYDPRTGIVEGTLSGYLGASYMAAYAKPLRDDYEDHTVAPRQAASLKVRMRLEKPFAGETDKPQTQQAVLDLALEADEDRAIGAFAVSARFVENPYIIDHIITFRWEVAKNLCVQPVRIGSITIGGGWPPLFSINYTGAGLSFGLPGAQTQWAKADVTFTVRDWKTVWKSQFKTFDSSESSDLLDEVDDADCVEVYFVEKFSPESMWGGGATFWSGESYTKIITSDGNVAGGVDLTHLAHELGHAMDLPHPTGTNSSSTNTLMCPSGWLNDNPKRNSQENKDNLSNPLLTFSLKLKTAGPDCTNSADCGACP